MLGCSLLRLLGATLSIPSLVQSIQHSSAYLRHAPPSLYITCDTKPASERAWLQRHLTRLLDAADDNRPPQTSGACVLSTTSVEDMHFENDEKVSSVLVGLPLMRSVEEAQRFVTMHHGSLRGLHLVVLPDLQPSAGCVVQALLRAFPEMRIACSAFGRVFLTDPTFFDGVRRVILSNDPHIRREEMLLVELDNPEARFTELTDNLTLPVCSKQQDRGSRHLQAFVMPSPSRREERRFKIRKGQPAHFEPQNFFLYDTAFHCAHIGATVGRLPWLSNIVKEASREVMFPLPPLLAAQHCREGTLLLETWRVEEAAESLAQALRRVPLVQHVLSTSYGELPGDVAEITASLEATAYHLEKLRSRLARRLEIDTGRDVQKWANSLLRKILAEVACPHQVSEPTAAEVMDAFVQWASEGDLGRLATTLTQAAMSLPPTALPVEPEGQQGDKKVEVLTPAIGHGPRRQPGAPSEEDVPREELEGGKGVRLLQSIFAKKGLGGLSSMVKKEGIDVSVFMNMNQDDFRRVFKATFGVTKRLEMLQGELRTKL